jgi:hypothetical protein
LPAWVADAPSLSEGWLTEKSDKKGERGERAGADYRPQPEWVRPPQIAVVVGVFCAAEAAHYALLDFNLIVLYYPVSAAVHANHGVYLQKRNQ